MSGKNRHAPTEEEIEPGRRAMAAEIERLRAALEALVSIIPLAMRDSNIAKNARRALTRMNPDQGIGALDAATEPEEK
jgi:hypothetical protein